MNDCYSYSYSRKLISRSGLTADACYIYKSGALYQGKKLWSVKHPSYFDILVFAPDYITAIETAARLYDTDWRKYDFYAFCDVSQI